MKRVQVSEQHLEVLTANSGATVPILEYANIEQDMVAQKWQDKVNQCLRYFGNKKLVKIAKNKLSLEEPLFSLIQAGKTNEKFFVLEDYREGELKNRKCMYIGETYVGVEQTNEYTHVFDCLELEELVEYFMRIFKQIKQPKNPIEVAFSKELYIKWMNYLNNDNEEDALKLLATLELDDNEAEIIWHTVKNNKQFFTLDSYVEFEKESQIMVSAAEYAVCLKFSESVEKSLLISTVSREDLSSLIHMFLLDPLVTTEDEIQSESEGVIV